MEKLAKLALFTCASDFPGGSDGKASVYNAGDLGSIPGLGRSPGEGNGKPLQDYCLENPMDRGVSSRAGNGSLDNQLGQPHSLILGRL